MDYNEKEETETNKSSCKRRDDHQQSAKALKIELFLSKNYRKRFLRRFFSSPPWRFGSFTELQVKQLEYQKLSIWATSQLDRLLLRQHLLSRLLPSNRIKC
jgi:hypothetical protein